MLEYHTSIALGVARGNVTVALGSLLDTLARPSVGLTKIAFVTYPDYRILAYAPR